MGKTFDLRVVFAVLAISALLAVLNNLRQPPERRVTWFGGQQVLAGPGEVVP